MFLKYITCDTSFGRTHNSITATNGGIAHLRGKPAKSKLALNALVGRNHIVAFCTVQQRRRQEKGGWGVLVHAWFQIVFRSVHIMSKSPKRSAVSSDSLKVN